MLKTKREIKKLNTEINKYYTKIILSLEENKLRNFPKVEAFFKANVLLYCVSWKKNKTKQNSENSLAEADGI